MNKLFTQGLVSICLFFGLWLALQQINWLTLLSIEQTQISAQETVGDLYWKYLSSEEDEITNDFVIQSVDSILSKICENNHLNPKEIQLHIVNNAEINAFALPNKHLILNSGLILSAKNDTELAGIICHEIAHMELNHVVKKLVKELGLSVITAISTDIKSGQIIREGLKLLSSSAYDRNLEKEADLKAVEYLNKAGLDSAPFANFLFRLSSKDNEYSKHFVWINTHPNSEDRAQYILKNSNSAQVETEHIIGINSWNQLKNQIIK